MGGKVFFAAYNEKNIIIVGLIKKKKKKRRKKKKKDTCTKRGNGWTKGSVGARSLPGVSRSGVWSSGLTSRRNQWRLHRTSKISRAIYDDQLSP